MFWLPIKSRMVFSSESISIGLPKSRTSLLLYCLTTVMLRYWKSSWLPNIASSFVWNVTTTLVL